MKDGLDINIQKHGIVQLWLNDCVVTNDESLEENWRLQETADFDMRVDHYKYPFSVFVVVMRFAAYAGFLRINRVPSREKLRTFKLSKLISVDALNFVVSFIFFHRIANSPLSGAPGRSFCCNDEDFNDFLDKYYDKLEREFRAFDTENTERNGAIMEYLLYTLLFFGCLQPVESGELVEGEEKNSVLSSRQAKLLNSAKRAYESDDTASEEEDEPVAIAAVVCE